MHDVFIQGEVAEAATMPNICEPNIFWWSWCINNMALDACCRQFASLRNGTGSAVERASLWSLLSTSVRRWPAWRSPPRTARCRIQISNSNWWYAVIMQLCFCSHIISWYQVADVSFNMLFPLLEVYQVANWGMGQCPLTKIWGLTSIDKLLMVHGFDPQPERYLCWLLLIEIYEFPVLDWSIYQVPGGFPLDV